MRTGKTPAALNVFFFSSRRRHTRCSRDWSFRRVLFRSYYVQDRHRIVFASEIAPLLEVPGVSRKAHPQTVYDFLSGAMGELADRTFFQDVRQLAAGHYLAISCASPGTAEPVCYWELERKRAQCISPQEASSGFRDLFEQSIRLHLRSDVPVGVSLSGGMDSSAITAMVRAVQGPGNPITHV